MLPGMVTLHEHIDRDLAEMIRQNGPQAEPAFRELYHRYAKRVYAYSLKALMDPATARDIVQDTFVRVLMRIRSGEVIESMIAFIMTICRNLCLNHKRDARMEYIEPDQIELVSHDEPYERRETSKLVADALQSLPEAYREPLLLQVYGGLSYVEICEVTGDSLPSVRHRIARAKIKLREILQPIYVDVSGGQS